MLSLGYCMETTWLGLGKKITLLALRNTTVWLGLGKHAGLGWNKVNSVTNTPMLGNFSYVIYIM